MSFAYHMFGSDITFLQILISVDDKQTWDTIFDESEEQPNSWQRSVLDLSDYHLKSGFLQIIAVGAAGNFGDIAIDDFNFYGSIYDPSAHIFYEDGDLDGYGNFTSVEHVFCIDTLPTGFSQNNLDCDDTNAQIHPDAIEINCNSIDENCNGIFNESGGIGMINIADANIKDETCQEGKNGQIELIIEGGVPPFSYNWSDATTNPILNNVTNGTYSCTIEDASGCQTVRDSLVVGISDSLLYEIIEFRNVTCLDTDNGLIRVKVEGGSGQYSYAWNNGDIGTPVIQNLSEGDYQVTIKDNDGCFLESENFTIIEDEIFTAFVDSIRHVSCNDNMDGFIRLNTTGISPVTEIIWSNNLNNVNEQSQLSGGYYGVTVSNSDGCTSTIDSILVIEPEELNFSIEAIEDIVCFGGSDGSIDISVSGGVQPYSFLWNNGDETEDIENIKLGFYSVTISDLNGCSINSSPLFVSSLPPIVLEIDSIHHVDCSGSFDGFLSLESSGGGGEFEYFWSNTTYAESNIVMNAPAGIYTVTVVDRFGCKSNASTYSIDLIDSAIPIEHEILDSNACFGDATADISIQATTQNLPIEFNWSTGTKRTSFTGVDTIFNLNNDLYTVTATDALGCTGISTINVEENDKLNFLNIVSPISCIGYDDGKISLNVSGGTPPYTYKWSNGETSSVLTELNPGSYACTISDAHECTTSTQLIYIEEPDPITIDESSIFHTLDSIEVFLEIDGGTGFHLCHWNSPKIFLKDGCKATSNSDGIIDVQIVDGNQCILDTFIFLDISTQVINTTFKDHQPILINNTGSQTIYINGQNIKSIYIYSINGELIKEMMVNDENHFNIQELYNGMYWIQYQLGQKIYSERFLKF